MKIEELHEILKKKHKKYVSDIVTVDTFDPSLGSDYKSIYITKKRLALTIIISQIDGKEDFEFWIQNNGEGEGCTISKKMDPYTVKELVNLIM